eukprot:UN04566
MRDRTTPRSEFVFHSDLMFRSLIEYSLELIDYEPLSVETSTGNTFNGLVSNKQITGVSILRSGAVLERPLMDSVSGVSIAKILVQRDDSTPDKKAKLVLFQTSGKYCRYSQFYYLIQCLQLVVQQIYV